VAVLITCRGVQGNTWPLLEQFKDKTEEPIQVIQVRVIDWLEPLMGQAMERKVKRMEGDVLPSEGRSPRDVWAGRRPHLRCYADLKKMG